MTIQKEVVARRAGQLALSLMMAFSAAPAIASGSTSARGIRTTAIAARKAAAAICGADDLTLDWRSKGLNRLTAGEGVRFYRSGARATGQIDRALATVRVPASYRNGLDEFTAANAKTIGIDETIAASYASEPSGRHVPYSEWVLDGAPLRKAAFAAEAVAYKRDIPISCVVLV